MQSTSLTIQLGIDLEQVYRKLPIGLCIVSRDGRLVAANDFHSQLAGRPASELIGVRVADINPEGGRNIERDFRAFDAGERVPSHAISANGRTFLISSSPIFDDKGAVIAISVAHMDVTEKRAAEREIEQLYQRLQAEVLHDHLTGVFNRRHFDEVLSNLTHRLQSTSHDFSLILFDVDRFKAYNDVYGHEAGDNCLVSIARAARACCEGADAVLCRYGGEEFAVVVSDPDAAAAVQIADAICHAVRQLAVPHIKGVGEVVTVSCGVASSAQLVRPLDPLVESSLKRAADEALYRAKGNGRDRVSVSAQPLTQIAESLPAILIVAGEAA